MEAPLRRPTRAQMVRSMNRDLLMGLLIPGPDRFELRGWVKWLIGNVPDDVPTDPVDRQRFDRLRRLDDEGVEALRLCARRVVSRVRGIEASGAYQRGVDAHDRLMSLLLGPEDDPHGVQFAALVSDADRLLAMLQVEPADIEEADFMAGFQWANQSLADAVAEELGRLS